MYNDESKANATEIEMIKKYKLSNNSNNNWGICWERLPQMIENLYMIIYAQARARDSAEFRVS